jgi:hypothetical protein
VLLQCAHCGAPLDVKDDASIVKCGYCAYKTERPRFVTIAARTPQTFAPPKVWRPPAEAPASSDVELPYKKGSGAGVVFFVLAMVLIGPAIAFFAYLHDAGTFAPKVDTMVGKSIDGTPVDVNKTLGGGGRVDEKSVYIKVDHPQIDQIYFTWEKEIPSHPTNVAFIFKNENTVPAPVCAALASTLGDFGGGYWMLGGVYVACEGSTLSAYASLSKDSARPDDGRWKKKVDTLYKVVMDALVGAKSLVGVDELRRVLGTGYAASDLARVDIGADVDHAEAMLEKALGGAVSTDNGERFVIRLAGTPLPLVTFNWQNSKGGKLSSVSFYSPGQKPLGNAAQAKIAACLTKTLGAPEIHEVDHLKQTVYYSYARMVSLYDPYISVSGVDAATWKALVSALDGCRI